MSRLNQTKRKQIIENALVKSGVVNRKAALIERRAKLAKDIYFHALGGEKRIAELQKLLDKTKKKFEVPDELEPHVTSNVYLRAQKDHEIYVAFGGRQTNLQFNGYPSRACESDKRVYYPFWHSQNSNRQLFAADHPFSVEFDAIEAEQKAIKDIETATRAEVGAVVNSVTTIKKLIDIWPEAVELLPAEETTTGTGVQVNIQTLNTLLSLPSEKEKGA